MTEANGTLRQFSALLDWLEELKQNARRELWLKPIANGKWPIREILVHILFWDRNSLEEMVPNMAEGAELSFVDIESLNREAAAFAPSYTDFDTLLRDVVSARQALLALLGERFDSSIRFNIDGEAYSFQRFVNVFIHHDEHHKAQIEAFLAREGATQR